MGADKIQAVQVQVRCEINDLMQKDPDTPSSLSSMAPLCPFHPFCSPVPYLAPTSVRSFSPNLVRFPRLTVTSSASEIASDVHPMPSCNLIVEY